MYLTTNSEEKKEVMNLKMCKEGCIGRFGKREGEKRCIMISKKRKCGEGTYRAIEGVVDETVQ